MSLPAHLIQRLRTTTVGELIRALERDGFVYRRSKGAGRVYRHADGRRVVIHYQHSSDTLPIGTLRSVLAGARWTESDLSRLGVLDRHWCIQAASHVYGLRGNLGVQVDATDNHDWVAEPQADEQPVFEHFLKLLAAILEGVRFGPYAL